MLLDTPLKRIKYMREASIVERCHREPILGSYNNGFHTYGMLCILREVEPDAPVDVLWHIIGHDQPERSTGDIPATSKWFGLIDSEKLDEVEAGLMHGLNFPNTPQDEYWKWTVKAIDLLELYYFCKDQIALGNTNLKRMHSRIGLWFDKNKDKIPWNTRKLIYESYHADWEYLPELSDDISE